MIDLSWATSTLIDQLAEEATAKGILIASDAPIEELSNAQRSIDRLKEEILRRTAW